MFAHLTNWRGSFATATTAGYFFGEQLYGTVHADGKHFIQTLKVGIGAATIRRAFGVLNVGAIATNIGPDHDPVFGMRANFAGQGQQHQRTFQLQLFCRPVLGD